eukprot:TRINITY_DN1595_c0_g1_i1.p1 TRINITY_DN1595_c0_g1~~TRINITY_DN1595_c0_g1_i1.p1  ORF type:complete len:114 (+),score=18.57 TRINITY_DN1595_c0_g1_i1:25-366(+)
MKVNLRLLEHIILGPNIEDDFSKTHFDRLHTSIGKRNTFAYFKEKCNGQNQMDENAATLFLRELTSLNDFEILDVIDLFDSSYSGTLGWKSFHLLVAAYAALASRQTVKFLCV